MTSIAETTTTLQSILQLCNLAIELTPPDIDLLKDGDDTVSDHYELIRIIRALYPNRDSFERTISILEILLNHYEKLNHRHIRLLLSLVRVAIYDDIELSGIPF